MRTRILRPVLALAFLLALNFLLPLSAAAMQAQSPDALASRVDGAYRVGAFSLSFANDGLRIAHAAEPARVLWTSVPGRAFLGAAQGQADIRQFGTPDGSYRIDDKLLAQCLAQSIDALERATDTLVVRGRLRGPGCDVAYRLTFDTAGANQLRFRLQLDGPQAAQLNRSYLRHASSADERYFGLGQQLTWFDQKGKTIPVLVQEHGVGRGLARLHAAVRPARGRRWRQRGVHRRAGAPLPQQQAQFAIPRKHRVQHLRLSASRAGGNQTVHERNDGPHPVWPHSP